MPSYSVVLAAFTSGLLLTTLHDFLGQSGEPLSHKFFLNSANLPEHQSTWNDFSARNCHPCATLPGRGKNAARSLHEIGIDAGTDKVGGGNFEYKGGHGYDRWYSWILEPVRYKEIKFLEIGLYGGASSQMWSEYLPNAQMYGMDFIAERLDSAQMITNGRIKVFQGDQANPEHLKTLINETGGEFDVIVDDGGHAPTQQVNSFKYLFAHALRPGGWYVVEDIETSYWSGEKAEVYGVKLNGGLGKTGTWVEISKLFIDTIQRYYHDAGNPRMKAVLETGADAMIDAMITAPNFMAFKKKGDWGASWDARPYNFPKMIEKEGPSSSVSVVDSVSGKFGEPHLHTYNKLFDQTASAVQTMRSVGKRRRV